MVIVIIFLILNVNVHPSKKEVRLSNDRELSNSVEQIIKETLKQENAIHEVHIQHKEMENIPLFRDTTEVKFDNTIIRPVNPRVEIKPIPQQEISLDINSLDVDIEKTDKPVLDNKVVENKEDNKVVPYFKVIGQILMTYIVIEVKDGFYLVDQHAANERINYEKFNKILNSKIDICTPLIPIVLSLSPSDIKRISDDKVQLLKEIGVEIESFGLNTIKVSSIPTFIKEYNEEKYLEELIQQVIRNEKIDIVELRKHVIATMACKASIKANDFLQIREMEDLVKTLFMCDNPTCCPHGRPTIVHFTKYDIEKMFKRSGI